MLEIITGAPGSGLTDEILRKVKGELACGKRQLIIVPETRSHEMERRLLKTCGNKTYDRLFFRKPQDLGIINLIKLRKLDILLPQSRFNQSKKRPLTVTQPHLLEALQCNH